MWSIHLVLFAWLSVCSSIYPEQKRLSLVLLEFEWNGLKVSEGNNLKNRKFLEAIASHLNLWNLKKLVVLNLSLFRATRGFKPFQDSLWCLNPVCYFVLLFLWFVNCVFECMLVFLAFCEFLLLVKVINLLFISAHVNGGGGGVTWLVNDFHSLTNEVTRWWMITCRGDLLNAGSIGTSIPALCQCWLSAVSAGLTLALR